MHWQKAAMLRPEEVMDLLRVGVNGLSDERATHRRKQYGYNRLTGHETRWWYTLARQFHSSFICLLLAASGLSFLLGERMEAGMMLLFVGINTLLGFAQEYRSTQSLALLKQYLVRRSRVRRDGETRLINSEDIVPGDIMVVTAGDKIAADMRFITVSSLMVDEETLTGESIAVAKVTEALPKKTNQMFEASSIGFAGTVVVRGSGTGVALSTGMDTALGEVAHLTEVTKKESAFEKGMRRFSVFIMKMVIVTIAVIFFVNIWLKGEGANAVELLIFSLVLVVSVIPEALPFVVTISLSRGSLRLAKKKVIVKRLSAIEDIGSIEVLCSDKTGTLTENRLSVHEIYASRKKECLHMAAIASDYESLSKQEMVDPFDAAIWSALSTDERAAALSIEKVSEVPFDPIRRRNSVFVKEHHSHKMIVRGAPETILALCGNVSEEDRDIYRKWMIAEGEEGYRVLAIAQKNINKDDAINVEDEQTLEYMGMISFVDPIKKTATQAIADAKRLGVEVKILTGDSCEVSGAVAMRIGLIASSKEVMTGESFDALSHDAKVRAVQEYQVFARVSPQQKYEIIRVLQEKKEVGFLGEGINDAPALKIANVALVVQSASDIAREAADVVLLDASLAVVIDGIREGRSIFANMIKYIKITLTSNFGNFYSVAIASLLIPFVPMLPLQILLIDILSDFPMIALATDAVDDESLRKPKGYRVKDIVLAAVLFGIISSVFDFILFAIFYRQGEAVLQTNWFILSLLTELVLIFSLRSRRVFFRAKRPSIIVAILALCMLIASIVIPMSAFGHRIFSFDAPTHTALMIILVLAGAYFIVTEVVKSLYYKMSPYEE